MGISSKRNKRIHIVHIIPALPYGGAERFLIDMSNMMVEQFPVDITIILFRDLAPMAPELDDRVTVISIDKKGIDPFFAHRLKKSIATLNPDIVHTHLWGGDVYGGKAARALGIPWLSTEHNVNVNESKLRHFIKRHAMKHALEIMITSEDERTFCHDVYHIPDAKLKLLPYYINLEKFLKLQVPTCTEPVQFLIVGRLVRQKGIETALKALGDMTLTNWHCTIVGIGPEGEKLQALAKQVGIEHHITWQAPNSDIAAVYAAHQVLLMPSLWEGFGIVGLEAQAAGLPVIGNMVGGLPEYVKHDTTGYLVPKNTVVAWTKAITEYLKHPERIATEAVAAKSTVRSEYAADRIAAAYYDWYTTYTK